MDETEAQQGNLQVAEIKRKPVGRSRGICRLMPEVRETIPGLFDKIPAEYVAEQFQVPRYDVLEEMIRDTRRRLGIGPRPALSVVRRRAVA